MNGLLKAGIAVALAAGVAYGQAGMTPEAQSYLDQARQAMVQREPGNPPFHVKASFTVRQTDERTRKASDLAGTYEETWLSPTQWRKEVVFNGQHFLSGRDGVTAWRMPATPSLDEAMLERCIAPAVPRTQFAEASYPPPTKLWQLDHVQLKGIALDRVGDPSSVPSHGKRIAPDHGYYFIPSDHALLLGSLGFSQFEFSKSAKIGNKFFPTAGSWSLGANSSGQFNVENLEANPKPAEDYFRAPPGATEHPATVQSGIMHVGRRVGGDVPIYPAIAKSAHIQGVVVIAGVIDANGQTTDLHVLAGPPLLRQAALEAVRTWSYQPYLLDGVPTPVSTEIQVNFTFGPR